LSTNSQDIKHAIQIITDTIKSSRRNY